jgi:hypothetical protein
MVQVGSVLDYLGREIGKSRKTELGGYKLLVEAEEAVP